MNVGRKLQDETSGGRCFNWLRCESAASCGLTLSKRDAPSRDEWRLRPLRLTCSVEDAVSLRHAAAEPIWNENQTYDRSQPLTGLRPGSRREEEDVKMSQAAAESGPQLTEPEFNWKMCLLLKEQHQTQKENCRFPQFQKLKHKPFRNFWSTSETSQTPASSDQKSAAAH